MGLVIFFWSGEGKAQELMEWAWEDWEAVEFQMKFPNNQ